ncbi:MAG: transposase [Opitutaceae bacterium]|nr:transposase [Opitutaceae bacterium]
MGRAWRIEYAGACYHVINRGNYRQNLFTGKGAAEAFIRVVGEAATRYHWRVHAYVVMNNHFHLAVELTEPNLSVGMKWLQGTWIRRYNKLRGWIGRPFQGRYKALLLEPGPALGQVCHYIHLNPVRARLVQPEQALDYPWSSLPVWTSKERPAWLEGSVVLGSAGGWADTKAGWKQYRTYLEFLATDAGKKKELVAERMSRGWCVGSREFKKEMREAVAQRGADLERERFAGLGPEEVAAERAAGWEEQLLALARAAKISLETLPAQKSHPDKALLAAALKQSTSVSNDWLGRRLAMGAPASASQFARRWQLTAVGRKATEQLLSRVKT